MFSLTAKEVAKLRKIEFLYESASDCAINTFMQDYNLSGSEGLAP